MAQGGTEILLLDLKVNGGLVQLSNPKNITNHKGYDNQPFFFKNKLFFSSGDNGQMDLKVFDLKSNSTSTFTTSGDNEFSPTITPDKKFISAILQQKDMTQDLVKFSLKTKNKIELINNLTVGYHAWINKNEVLLFILEDSVTFNLHRYNVKTKADEIVAKNIGRSIHKIPGTDAMSFVEKVSTKEWLIRRYEPGKKFISTIATALPQRDNLAWTTNGLILMSDGKEIFYNDPSKNNGWQKVKFSGDANVLKGITRLAVNDRNNKLAVVVAE